MGFEKWISVSKYAALVILTVLLGVVFVGFVINNGMENGNGVKFKVRSEAENIDVWKFLPGNGNMYHLKALSMGKERNGELLLRGVNLWYFKKNSGKHVYVKAAEAVVYPDNSVDAYGGVCAHNGRDVEVCTSKVRWNSSKRVLSSSDRFRGFSKNSVFRGKGFVYYYDKDLLVAGNVDIWLK